MVKLQFPKTGPMQQIAINRYLSPTSSNTIWIKAKNTHVNKIFNMDKHFHVLNKTRQTQNV